MGSRIRRRPAIALTTAVAVMLAVASAGSGASSTVRLGPPAKKCEAGIGRWFVLVAVPGGAIDCGFPDSAFGGVDVALSDGQGGWFVGESEDLKLNVAHLNHDGALDRSWHASIPASWRSNPNVVTMALSGSTLYAAGPLGVEALDAATGARLWLDPVNGQDGVVAVAANSHTVFIGGSFTRVGHVTREWLAALDPRTGRVLPWKAEMAGTAPGVTALALSGPRLYVGADAKTSLFALDAESGKLLPWNPATALGYASGYGVGDVGTIVVADGPVFTAGHDGFGITNAHTGAKEEKRFGATDGTGFASYGDTAYLAGNCRNSLTSIQGQPRNNLGSINLTTGHVTNWAPNIATFTCVEAIAADRDQVLVSGSFSKTLG